MTDTKYVSRFDSIYASASPAATAASYSYSSAVLAPPVYSAVAPPVYSTAGFHASASAGFAASATRTYSTSPARREVVQSPSRREVIHHAEPIVERVVEYENMCTPELMACAASTKVEAEKMRIRSSEYEKLVEEHRVLSATYNDHCSALYKYRAEHEAIFHQSAVQISSHSAEIHSGNVRLDNTRRHITNLTESHKRTVESISVTDIEIAKCREHLEKLAAEKVINVARHKEQTDQLNLDYEANHKTSIEIHETHVENNKRSVQLHELNVQVNYMESQKEHTQRNIDNLNILLEQRTNDVTTSEARIVELQAEISSLVVQVTEITSRIDAMRITIDTIVTSNQKLSDQVHETSVRNCEISANINDLTVRSNAMESRIICMRNESEACKSSNGCFLDNNSNLQTQVTTMKGHNSVLGGQNASISTELQTFVNANEAMRVQLDRRARVFDQVRRNEESIAHSVTEVHRSRSPMRRVVSSLETSYHHVPVAHHVTVQHVPVHHVPVHHVSTLAPVTHFGASVNHSRSFTTYLDPSSPLLQTPVRYAAPASPAPAAQDNADANK